MNIPKWMKRCTPPSEPISKIEMVHTDLCEAEDDVREYIDKIENVKPTCLRRDEAKINTLSHRLDGLRGDRDLLRNMKHAAITTALNRFPINTPCTLTHISNKIGVVVNEVNEAMMSVSHHHRRHDAEKARGECWHGGYDYDVSDDGMMLLEFLDRNHNSHRYGKWRVTTIKISGWRFIQSERGHIYLERIS